MATGAADTAVLFFVPNLICYCRIVVALYSTLWVSDPAWFACLYILVTILDATDGFAARALDQCSRLGELLDVIADNIVRACAWVVLALAQPAVAPVAVFVIAVEWCTMLATQFAAALDGGRHWKQQRAHDPWLIRFFFSNNFFNPLGITGIMGLFFCPVAWYLAVTTRLGHLWYGVVLLTWVTAGRLLSLGIEMYFISDLVKVMLVHKRLHYD